MKAPGRAAAVDASTGSIAALARTGAAGAAVLSLFSPIDASDIASVSASTGSTAALKGSPVAQNASVAAFPASRCVEHHRSWHCNRHRQRFARWVAARGAAMVAFIANNGRG
jgi:hypothetical protein